jgi:hypothetical protein
VGISKSVWGGQNRCTYRKCVDIIQVAQDRNDKWALDVAQLVHAPVELDDVEVREGRQQPSSRCLRSQPASQAAVYRPITEEQRPLGVETALFDYLKEAGNGKHARTGWMTVVNSLAAPRSDYPDGYDATGLQAW